MEESVARVRGLLQRKDLRLTPQREAILRLLIQEKERHLSADEVLSEVRSSAPDLGLATVYRTLELFEAMGVLHRFDSGDGTSRYEFSPQAEEHYHHHLICAECGKITEFKNDLLDTLEETILRDTGFEISDHCLRFFGKCLECRDKK